METNSKKLPVNHLNIRESINILVIKLIVIDIITAFFVGLIYIGGTTTGISGVRFSDYPYLVIMVFTLFVILKIFLNIYVVIEWLNEYYELYPDFIVHKKGVFFKKEKRVNLKGVTEIQMYQPIIGKLLNFGTIVFLNYRKMELMTAYLIHNPTRYEKIVNDLIAGLSEEKETIREHIFEHEED